MRTCVCGLACVCGHAHVQQVTAFILVMFLSLVHDYRFVSGLVQKNTYTYTIIP